MGSTEDIAKGILAMSEDRYFKEDESLLLDMELKLADTEFKGVAINAPGRVSMDKQAQLPVVMAIQQTGLRAWEFPRDMNCVLAATNLATRVTYFGQVFRDPKAETFSQPVNAPQPPKPEGVDAIALSSGVHRIDARAVLALPQQAGRYRLWVMMCDWVSNTVEVELEGGPGPQPSMQAPPAPGKHLGMPSFLPAGETPSLSGEESPLAALTATADPQPGVALAVYGAFRVGAAPFHIPAKPLDLKEIDGEQKNVGAIVPVTLAIIGKNWATPLRFDYGIPVYSETAPKTGDRINGYFSMDALADSQLSLAQGEYSAYLIVEGRVFGPNPLTKK